MPCRLRRCQGRRGCLCPKAAATGAVYAGVLEADAGLTISASGRSATSKVAPAVSVPGTPAVSSGAEEVQRIFDKFDINGDGYISRLELIRIFQRINPEHWTHSKCCQLFAALDLNQDQEIMLDELVTWLFTHEEEGNGLFRVVLEQPAQSVLPDVETSPELMQAAMDSLVPADEAMHPQRAQIGSLLMQEVQEFLMGRDAEPTVPDATSDAAIRQIFLDSMPARHTEIIGIEQVMQPELLKYFLQKVAEERSCVELTFHGTGVANVPVVLKHGLTSWIRKSRRITAVYGEGAYVGTHAGVAHRYAMTDDAGTRHMFCVLADTGTKVVLGRRGGRNESTVADKLCNPTQYCLVEDDRLAVTHLIRYRTTGRLAESAPAHDRALAEAMRRAGEQLQKLGHR